MLLLLSGGLDSAVCLAETRPELCLTFDYGQRHRVEVERARELADWRGCFHRVITLDCLSGSALTKEQEVPNQISIKPDATYVPGRNTVFLSIAFSIAEANGYSSVVIGSNADDHAAYPDCRSSYFFAFQDMARQGMVNPPRVVTPNILRTKRQVAERARELDVPIDRTWSCYNPKDDMPCGHCGACILRGEAIG